MMNAVPLADGHYCHTLGLSFACSLHLCVCKILGIQESFNYLLKMEHCRLCEELDLLVLKYSPRVYL